MKGPLPVFAYLLLIGCTASQAQAQTWETNAREETGEFETSEPDSDEPKEMDRQGLLKLISNVNSSQPGYESGDRKETRIPTGDGMTASKIWEMSDKECLDHLADNGVATAPPTFPTQFVRTPLLLEGPVVGVTVKAKWSKNPAGSVMDCRLIAALVELCRWLENRGVVRLEFYSTWRPVPKPPPDCDDVKRKKRCEAKREAYAKAERGKFHSQHNRAAAIDVRWFTFEDGTVIDVLEDYEVNLGNPPCDDEPETEKGRFLMELACHLHGNRIFNVVLTPNANKAHANHLHFDITPGATWYIVR